MRIIPIIILGAITLIGLGIEMERHGKKREGKHSVWASLIANLVWWGLLLWAIL